MSRYLNVKDVLNINDRDVSDINLNVRFLKLVLDNNNNINEVKELSDKFYDLIRCLNAFEIKLFIIRNGADELKHVHKIPGEWLKTIPAVDLTEEEKLINSAFILINTLINDNKIKELLDNFDPIIQILTY